MTLTVDASVWIASAYAAEPNFESSRRLIRELLRRGEELASPNLLLVEVAAAAARKTRISTEGVRIAQRVESFPWHRWYPLDSAITASATHLAVQLFLRGADSIYVSVAAAAKCPLVTLDQELLIRASPVTTVTTPSDWLRQHVA